MNLETFFNFVPNLPETDEYILLIHSDAYYGDIEDLREHVEEHINNGGDVSDCYLGFYNRIPQSEVYTERKVKVTDLSEESYVESTTYKIINASTGEELDSDILDGHVEDAIVDILQDDPDLNVDDIHIVKSEETNVEFETEIDQEIVFSLPLRSQKKTLNHLTENELQELYTKTFDFQEKIRKALQNRRI